MPEFYRPPVALPDLQEPFLERVNDAQDWLERQGIEYRFVGSLATSAYLDAGTKSLDLNRQDAYTRDQRVPDLDLLVPKDALSVVKAYGEELMRDEDCPVNVDLYIASCYIDFQPDAEDSFLTHKKLRVPVNNKLFAPTEQTVLGQPIITVDARTLFHTYVTAGGMLRDKDMPKIMGLARTIRDSEISQHAESEYSPFHDFIAARQEAYPLFLATKRGWEFTLSHLPKTARRAAVHYVIPRVQQLFRSR